MSWHTWFGCYGMHPADESRKEDTELLSWIQFAFHSMLTRLQDFSKKPSNRKTTQTCVHMTKSTHYCLGSHTHTQARDWRMNNFYIHATLKIVARRLDTTSTQTSADDRGRGRTQLTQLESSAATETRSCWLTKPTISFLWGELHSQRFNTGIN